MTFGFEPGDIIYKDINTYTFISTHNVLNTFSFCEGHDSDSVLINFGFELLKHDLHTILADQIIGCPTDPLASQGPLCYL
jgi:hypothetical protein